MVDDPYAVLGLTREATDDEVRRAYERRLADAAAVGDFQRAARVDAAYGMLRDPHRRRMYDRDGRAYEPPRLPPEQRWAPPQNVPWRQWTPAEPVPRAVPTAAPARRRNQRGVFRTLLVLTFAVVSAVGVWRSGLLAASAGQRLLGDVWRPAANVTAGPPVSHHLSTPGRLLPAVTPVGTGPYALEHPGPGEPPRWDPCQPVRYVVSGSEPFPGAVGLLTSALAEASADSGLQFLYEGTTTEPAADGRAAYQPDRYGQRWAPVLIAWTDPSRVASLAGPIVGLGGGTIATRGGQSHVVSGIVYLDAPDVARISQMPDGITLVRTILLHEVGHLLGLAHVNDPTSVMYPSAGPLASYAAGDREGLALLGRGSCSLDY